MSEAWRLLQASVRAIGIDDLTPSHAEEVGMCNLIVEAVPGDHIAVRRAPDVAKRTGNARSQASGGGAAPFPSAWHHGIFLCGGRDSAVIDNTPERGVQQRSLADFTKDATQAVIVRYDNDSVMLQTFGQLAARVLACAKPAAIYDVVGFNCEGFATWCRTGKCVLSIDMPPWPAATSNKATLFYAGVGPSKSTKSSKW